MENCLSGRLVHCHSRRLHLFQSKNKIRKITGNHNARNKYPIKRIDLIFQVITDPRIIETVVTTVSETTLYVAYVPLGRMEGHLEEPVRAFGGGDLLVSKPSTSSTTL